MTAETHLYFPLMGNETSAYVKVRLFKDGQRDGAEATVEGSGAEDLTFEYPARGEPLTVLRDARDFAAGRGLDVRVELDGVEWDSDLGVLVDSKA